MSEYVIAKYLRLSIDDSQSNSMSIENQRLLCDKHIATLDIPNATVMELVDNGYSGTNFERPAVQELLELVRTGKVNCIIVKDFSRFGRNAIEMGYFIERVFPLYQTRFIAVSDSFDSADYKEDTGGMEVAFKFLIHEYYSKDLSRKIKSAKHERMRRGEYLTKNCVFGYKKTLDNQLAIDETAAETVRRIFELAHERHSLSETATHLYNEQRMTPGAYRKSKKSANDDEYAFVWPKATILKILDDEQYIGTYIAGKTCQTEVGSRKQKKVDENDWYKIPDHHPAIIEKVLFYEVQDIIGEKGEPLRNRKIGTWGRYAQNYQSPLKGKVVCGCCGHVMRISLTKNAMFHCWYTYSATDAECHRLRTSKSELEKLVYKVIKNQAKAVLGISNLSETPQLEIGVVKQTEYERQISSCNDKKRSLYEQFVMGELNAQAYRAEKTDIAIQLDRLTRSLALLKTETKPPEYDLQAITDDALKAKKLTLPLVEALIEKIRIYPTSANGDSRVKIEWKIADFCSTGKALRI